MAAAIATTAGSFITASSAVAHDIYTELVDPEATRRQQMLVGRATVVGIGALVTVTAFDPPAPVVPPRAPSPGQNTVDSRLSNTPTS